MPKLRFLLEIGTEEIPDWMIVPALNQLQDHVQTLFDGFGLKGRVSSVDATPRRLALRAEGLIERQPDSEDLLLGPPKAAGEGAANGFARKNGITVDQLITETTARGEYFAFRKKIEGRPALDILSEALPGIILKIQWPKAMYWTGKSGPRFIRPIRWLVALLGKEVVPFELAGVKSGNVTSGHRELGRKQVKVSIGSYEKALAKNGVVLSADERRKRIEDGIAELTGNDGLRVKGDPDLLHTLVYITEYPTPILGSFDPQYLELPSEVLVTVMRHHQKYFSVEAQDGTLAPNFIAVMNTAADPEGLVRKGNERVLRARFNDARFFYEVDQQKKLADRVADLAHVTFQAKLGSYLQKTERISELAGALAEKLGADKATVQRAATLSRTDLTTEMVKEFTELQGVVGGLYAKAQGEPEDVWKAIYDHYKPASMEDAIPSTLSGLIVSAADKLDTLKGCFAIGLVPTGSKDPFALRRAAQGLVRIIVEGKLALNLSDLLGDDAALRDFIADRVKYYFREIRGFKYDEVNAVMASGWNDLVDVEARLSALQSVRPTENFGPLAASFKRIANILKQAGVAVSLEARSESSGVATKVSEWLLQPGPEYDLYNAFLNTAAHYRTNREIGQGYDIQLRQIASIRPAIDLFFDKVLVNDPDAAIRQNRLALLRQIVDEFSTIADFSEIVTQ